MTEERSNTNPIFSSAGLAARLPGLVVFGFLWGFLINHLRMDWSLNPQYGYGWAVPVLCGFLLLRQGKLAFAAGPAAGRRLVLWGMGGLALLYAPLRLVEAANPDWRRITWMLALEVVSLTLLMIYLNGGARATRRAAFPVLFFLVAVPWPDALESSVIQGLTRADTRVTVELLGWLVIPALPEGNVISVAAGQVGINEACSGIRSFQATLMIALFMGELYRLSLGRRAALLAGGFALSLTFNLARMTTLVWVAARQGMLEMEHWHDPLGTAILLGSFLGLWGLGLWLAPRPDGSPPPPAAPVKSEAASQPRGLVLMLVALAAWFALVEVSVSSWYRWHERRLPTLPTWTVAWLGDHTTFQTNALSDQLWPLLHYDEGRSVGWESDGLGWQAVFLRWKPGGPGMFRLSGHNPNNCMPAAGHPVTRMPDKVWLSVAGLRLPFDMYAVGNFPDPAFVFYCLWDDRASPLDLDGSLCSGLRPVLAGLRGSGHRSLEILITGNVDALQAQADFQRQLSGLIHVQPNLKE